ncbi:MAG: hypothetical protein COA96_14985 [SAR86 cluster bacterium]|uniref:DUF3267 domain-containing protein n=1 Tax=SAR86 cluster bacterium TaxID=2030880 RepID=A0A2A5ARS2_9GAMM|nr:MAG: hypothetical protein COA96_14985 [SAR86 cluster bacterium]
MIPGVIISILTFPGVIIHEWAHKKFCDWFDVPVHEIKYFSFGSPAGYVIHETTDDYNATFWISVGPFIINTFVALLFGLIAGFLYDNPYILYFFGWLSISVGMHSFPSTHDVKNILEASKNRIKTEGNPLHYLSYPLVLIVQIANLLKFFWIDLAWAVLILVVAFTLSGAPTIWTPTEDSFDPAIYFEDDGREISNKEIRASFTQEELDELDAIFNQ